MDTFGVVVTSFGGKRRFEWRNVKGTSQKEAEDKALELTRRADRNSGFHLLTDQTVVSIFLDHADRVPSQEGAASFTLLGSVRSRGRRGREVAKSAFAF